MPARIRAILTKMDLTLPVTGGRCALGIWQGSTSTSTAPGPISAR
jgi:thiamine phosphate synthase YjbQ (UPF0047 family)